MNTTHRLLRVASLMLALAAVAPAIHAVDAVTDIPRLSGVAIDGQTTDWAGAGLQITAWHYSGDPGSAGNFLPTARLAWDDLGLLVRVDVTDDAAIEAPAADALWQRDSIEIFIAAGADRLNRYQLVVAPGTNRAAVVRHWAYDRRSNALRAKPLSPILAAARNAAGYLLEARLPWDALGIEPHPGTELSLQLVVNDSDGGERVRAGWNPGDAAADVAAVCRLRLAATASPAVTTAIRAVYDPDFGVRVDVCTSGRTNGLVTVSDAGNILCQLPLGGTMARAITTAALPLPGPGRTYGTLTVVIDGVTVGTCQLPDATALRRIELERAELRYTPVFSGERLPAFALEKALWIQGLVGPCRITARYLNADYREVTRAATPGRYGALVTITPALGDPVTRRITLYRQPSEMKWRPWEWSTLRAGLPPELGIPAPVVEQQRAALADFMKWRLADALSREGDAAVLLAGLSETPTNAPPATRRNAPPATRRRNVWDRDRLWWYGLDRREGRSGYPHRVFLPKGYERDPTQRWPLVLYLHGSGERGSNLALLDKNGMPRLIAAGTNFPFIVLAPQCQPGTWWFAEALGDLLDDAQAKYRVDADRVYCTGLSMGGFGTWSLAAVFPERLAAIVPICGGGDPEEAAAIRSIPAWVFHGGRDTVVPTAESERMVTALRQAGAAPKFTVYPEAGHDSWTAAYDTAALYEWMLTQRRGAK